MSDHKLTFRVRTTRPFGFWGPLKGILTPCERQRMRREHYYDIICVPFALTWQVCLFMMPMQLLLRDFRSFTVTLSIFACCGLFLYKFWYRQLPSAEPVAASAEPVPELVETR